MQKNLSPGQRQMLKEYARFATRALLQRFERTGDVAHLIRLRELLEDFAPVV